MAEQAELKKAETAWRMARCPECDGMLVLTTNSEKSLHHSASIANLAMQCWDCNTVYALNVISPLSSLCFSRRLA